MFEMRSSKAVIVIQLLVARGDLTLTLFSRSRRELQKSGQNIAMNAPMVRIEIRIRSHELAGHATERSP